MIDWADVETAARAAGYKRAGRVWRGRCPLCDRRTCTFQPGNSATWVAYCWSCNAPGLELARALIGEPYRPPAPSASNLMRGFPSPARSGGGGASPAGVGSLHPAPAAARTGQSERPGRVWAAAGAVNGSPGALYLALRGIWTGEHPSVRWLPRDRAAGCRLSPELPSTAAGCLVWRFAVPGEAATFAAQVEAVDGAGRRGHGWRMWDPDAGQRVARDDGKDKRIGVAGSAFGEGRRIFEARPVTAGRVMVCEGPADALALARLLPIDAGVYGVAGTSGLRPAAVEGVNQVVIAEDCDPDGEGPAAARKSRTTCCATMCLRLPRSRGRVNACGLTS